MLLHQVKNVLLEKSRLESGLRVFEHVIQQLMTNQVQVTSALNTSQPSAGLFRICGYCEATSGLFGICGSAKPTSFLSGGCGFSVMSCNLPRYEGNEPWTMSPHFVLLWSDTW